MSAYIYIEGGGDSRELHARCRAGFSKLLEKCGFKDRMPRLVASGGRDGVFKDFRTACADAGERTYVAMLVDSEDPVADIEKTWNHLADRDGWRKPDGADDKQVLLMTTCMETWIVTDRTALRTHFKAELQESALPAVVKMESRSRGDIQKALTHATRNCKNAYIKDKRSFEIVGNLTPETLASHLPSFERVQRVLREKL